MSGVFDYTGAGDFDDHLDLKYHLGELDELPLSELRQHMLEAVKELKYVKNEFDEF